MNTIILTKLSDLYRESRKQESILSKEVDQLIVQLENKLMPYKDYDKLNELFHFRSKQLAELNQYNNGLHDAREIVLDTFN